MQTVKVSPKLQAISDRAYLYAFGMDRAYQHLYETMVKPDYPANRFQIIRHLADDKYTAHPTINNDTLHLMGWLDVAAEPVIVSVPDHDDGRYWVLHTMDMGHYTTCLFGKRTRGPKGGRFVPPAGNSWLERVNFVLADGTMATADAHWLEGLEASGLGAGKLDFTAEQLAAAEISEKHGLARLKEVLPTLTNASKSLGTREKLGNGDRTLFAAGTYVGQWGAPPVEASYVQMVKDQNGDILNGANDYSVTFTPPKVSPFWSVTAYGSRTMLMIANDLNRHSRGDRHVKLHPDGTVTLRLSHETTGMAEDTNFLPVPNEDFYLVLRMYGGDEDIQAGKFPVPVVQKVGNKKKGGPFLKEIIL